MKTLTFFLVIFLSASNAQAGFFVDPHVGFKIQGDAKLSGRTFSHDQLEFGTKLGWHSGYTQLGLDLNLLYPTYQAQDSTETEESYSGFQYGFFIGGRWTWLRGWATWVIGAQQSGDINFEKYKKGSGWEFGVGLGPQNMINGFIKFQMLSFRAIQDSNGFETILSGGQEFETRAIIVGIDLPINTSGKSK